MLRSLKISEDSKFPPKELKGLGKRTGVRESGCGGGATPNSDNISGRDLLDSAQVSQAAASICPVLGGEVAMAMAMAIAK